MGLMAQMVRQVQAVQAVRAVRAAMVVPITAVTSARVPVATVRPVVARVRPPVPTGALRYAVDVGGAVSPHPTLAVDEMATMAAAVPLATQVQPALLVRRVI